MFDYDEQTGWLKGVRRCPSPNYDARPEATPISLLVIHNISLPPGEFGSAHIDQLFCNTLDPCEHPYFAEIQGLEVSSHLLIRRDGEVVQYVPLTARAWHAGQSHFEGCDRCNDFSIGIEMEGTDDQAYTDAQYATLTPLSEVILAHFPDITPHRIAGHADISPGRKTDPGPSFDWLRYRHSLQSEK